jgi:hypothetical protein
MRGGRAQKIKHTGDREVRGRRLACGITRGEDGKIIVRKSNGIVRSRTVVSGFKGSQKEGGGARAREVESGGRSVEFCRGSTACPGCGVYGCTGVRVLCIFMAVVSGRVATADWLCPSTAPKEELRPAEQPCDRATASCWRNRLPVGLETAAPVGSLAGSLVVNPRRWCKSP